MKHLFTFSLLFYFGLIYSQCTNSEISHANWSVHSFSTEEASGEGPNNGQAIHAIDDNPNTFWHSQWQNFTNSFPHFIAYDMGESFDVSAISITSRHNSSNNKVKAYELYLSQDGSNWEPLQAAGEFVYPNLNDAGQTAMIEFGAVSARYIKLEMLSPYNDTTHAAIAEFKAFEITGGADCVATGQNNQVLVLEEIEQRYATDDDFVLTATSSSDNPIVYEVVSGPATINGNTLSLSGNGGTVTVKAYQEANAAYYATEVIQSFEVINLAEIQPQIITRLTESYPIEMTSLSPYKLVARGEIAEPDALDVSMIEFYVNNVLIESTEGANSFYTWWTPSDFGEHQISIKAIASNGNETTENYSVNVTNTINNRSVVTLQNAVIDWGSIGSQWYYGTYELPQFTGSYESIIANFNVTCPNVSGGCDDWDRLGYLQIKNPDGQWIELIRYITPYGVACDHTLDVTDYASVLQGEVEFRMYIETWGTGGWELELVLDYNEGTPEYMYTEIEEIWHGTYNFGDLANLQPVPEAVIVAPQGTEAGDFRVVTTGHGWGNNSTGNAAEFYYALHNFNINSSNVFQQNMEVNCDPNPDGCTGQQGTWYYSRAGWCPGSIAKVYKYDISEYIDNEYSFEYEFEPGYVDYCHPNNPDCVSGSTCDNCNDGYNPHYRIAAYNVYKGNSPLGQLATKEIINTKENKLSIYPNPSNGIFRMELAEEMTNANVQIYTTDGQSLKKFNFTNKHELESYTFNVSDLATGLYFVKIYNEKQMATTKLIIK